MKVAHARRWAARVMWLAIAMVLAVAGLSVPAQGTHTTENVAVEWNRIASTAIIAAPPAGDGQAPHASVLTLAMVQGAVYDAVNAIDGGYQPYLGSPDADSGDSREAAVAAAAFRVLTGFPENTPALAGVIRPGNLPTLLPGLQSAYTTTLGHVPDGPAEVGGIEVGEAAAAAMLTERIGDGRGGSFTFPQGSDPGEWRNAPPQGPLNTVAIDPAPWVGFVRPFLFEDLATLEATVRTAGPNELTSEKYAKEFNEVKEVGSLTSTKRTSDQTAAAIFWQDSGPAIWNRVYRALAVSRELDIADSARLFAMTNLAAADGSIGCWNDKAYWSFWRPITAIREAASDGNPATEADPNWLPLFDPSVPVSGPPLITPGFPDHPAGHTCISGATVHALQSFFGTDKIPFTAVSNKCLPAPCANRSFERFSLALKEIIDARVWGGIHFRTADVQGATLGKKVARFLDANYFQPVASN
jgi:hypothetical protein